MSGVYAITRSLWDHPAFKAEPFTEREAWSWMVGEAAWQPRRARVGRLMVNLGRGQLCHSRRFLAGKWQWDESKVRRFLDRLTKEHMIDRAATGETTTLTICNYDKYQFGQPSRSQQKDSETAKPRPKEEELKNSKTDVDDGVPPPLLSDAALEIAKELGVLCGFTAPIDWPPQWAGAPMRVQTWLNTGWSREMIVTASREALAKKRDGPPNSINYFEKPIVSFIAKQSAPLPQAKIIEGETVNVIRPDAKSRSKDDFRAALGELRSYAAEGDRGTGDETVRLLPAAGRS